MKTRVAVILGMLLTTLLSVFVLVGPTPGDGAGIAPKDTAPPEPPEVVEESQPRPSVESAPVPPSPASGKPDFAQVEEEFNSLVDPLPGLERFKRWAGYKKRSRMSAADFEKARELYLRFLVNLARIDTARFHVDVYEGNTLLRTEEVTWSSCKWSAPKYRVEQTYRDGKTRTALMICDGKTAGFVGPSGIIQRLRLGRGEPSNYFHNWYVPMAREARPPFLNEHTACEIDDGSRGYSSVIKGEGSEIRFDTATGLLTEYVFKGGGGIKDSWQQVGGLWFPREQVWNIPADPEQNQEAFPRRFVFSHVVLNEPVDETLFDMDAPR